MMMRDKLKKILAIMLCVVFAAGSSLTALEVYAAEETKSIVVVESYSVTNDVIVPGENFTLDLYLMNYSNTVTAQDVIVSVTNPDYIAPLYGTTGEVYVGTIGPNEVKKVSIEYFTWDSLSLEAVDFNVEISSRDSQRSVVLRMKAGVDLSLKAENITAPDVMTVNTRDEITMKLSVLGAQSVGNIVLYAESNGEEIAKSNVGNLASGTSKNQSLGLSFSEEGSYEISVKLSYMDADGTENTIEVYRDYMEVEAEENNSDAENAAGSENTLSKTLIIGVSGVLIALVCGIILVLVNKKR